MGEAFLINMLAVGLALLLMQLSSPLFDELTGRPLTNSGFTNSLDFFILVVGLLLVSMLGSGLYPSLMLSGHTPIGMLRRVAERASSGWGLRRTLVVGQFVGTVVMLVAIITVYRQLQFLQHHDLGLSIDQMLVVKAPLHDFNQDSIYRTRFDVFRAGTTQIAGVQHMTTSSVVPGDGINTIGGSSSGVYWKKRVTSDPQTFYFVNVDEKFIDTYGVRRLAGSGFRAIEPQWRNRFIINRAALKALGFPSAEAAVNEALVFGTTERAQATDSRIVGVIDDFHIESLKLPTRPTLYTCAPPSQMAYYSFRLEANRIKSSIEQIGQLWKQLYPDSPFNYFFLDQKFNEQYRAERQFSQLFGFFTGLAILIACLGLFGLATFTAEQRTKEIGVRKVLGASVSSIVTLLSKDFLKLVLIAVVIASPLAWWAMTEWLTGFAYKIDIEWWVFLLAGTLAMGIALLTVSFQSVKAALMNPVKSLRSE
jgi:putative ABC transport system permease protein